jgi:BirA family biotin operon repressor/biotin-[acetyl-CoA-carboxylase] ligase
MHVRPAAPYAIAVAAAEALNALGIPARIKWPNDLLCGSAKISGMLSEYSGGFLVIGIGVNIKVKPAVEYATAKTDDFVPGLLPTDVLAALMKKFDEWLEADLDAAKKRWNELAGLL